VIANYEHSSLFGLVISNEGKKFYNIGPRSTRRVAQAKPPLEVDQLLLTERAAKRRQALSDLIVEESEPFCSPNLPLLTSSPTKAASI